jgi:hypothetical protein
MPDPWAKLPTESAEAFAAFESYRQLGIKRTPNLAYQAHTGRDKPAPGTWRGWYRKHHWKPRAEAWDIHQHGIEQKARDQVRSEIETNRASHRAAFEQSEQELLDILRNAIIEMKSAAIFKRRTAVSEDGRTVIVHEPARFTVKTMIDAVKVYSMIGRVHHQMPSVPESAPSEDFRDLFFDTDGQFEAALPSGAVPPMPEDPLTKPAIGSAARAGGDSDGKLRQPGIIRPQS